MINWEEGDSTVIRYGFMNYYKSSGANENYLPMILRGIFILIVVCNIIRLYWSGSTGTLKAYKPVTVTGLAKTGCLVSSGANIYHVVTN